MRSKSAYGADARAVRSISRDSYGNPRSRPQSLLFEGQKEMERRTLYSDANELEYSAVTSLSGLPASPGIVFILIRELKKTVSYEI